MTGAQIIVSARSGTPRLALLEDGQPVALRLFPESARPFAGERLAARVTRIAKEINAAFLISDAGELLLPFEKAKAKKGPGGKRPRNISDCVHEGERVTLRVIREADPADGKLAVARLSDNSDAAGDGPDSGLASLIAHMAGAHNAAVTIDERTLYLAVKRLAGAGGSAGEISLWVEQGPSGGRDIFEEFAIQEAIDEATTGALPLASGGSIRIEPTRTLTAIDVDTGGGGKGRDAARTRLNTNIEAAGKIAWALRFLDIGGLVVIDFVSMQTKADRNTVLEALDAALASDPAVPERSGFSRFGLVELARRKRGPSILQRLAAPDTGEEGKTP